MLLLLQVWFVDSLIPWSSRWRCMLSVHSVNVLCLCWPLQVSVATRNAHSCTLILNPKSKTVPGMIEASANTVSPAPWWALTFVSNYVKKTYTLLLFWIFFHPPVSGPDCRHRHTRRVICVNYLVGFCPEGKSCKFMQYVFLFILFLHNRNSLGVDITPLAALLMGWIMSSSAIF